MSDDDDEISKDLRGDVALVIVSTKSKRRNTASSCACIDGGNSFDRHILLKSSCINMPNKINKIIHTFKQ